MAKQRLDYYDNLKMLAIITMMIDHIGHYFFPELSSFRLIGRISAPIFFFLVGFSTSAKFDKKILLYALILQLIYIIFERNYSNSVNILFIILLLRYSNEIFSRINHYVAFIIFFIALSLNFLSNSYAEYGTIAFAFSLIGYYARKYDNLKEFFYPFTVIIAIIHSISQQLIFGFNQTEIVILFIIQILLCCIFVNPTVISLKILNCNLRNFLAKFALQIYFLHKLLFEILYFAIN